MPEFLCFLGLEQAFELANRIMKHSENTAYYNQELCYDTTFNIGEFFISTLLIRNIEMGEEPYFPVAFFIHDRKKTETHQYFFKKIKKLLQINLNIPFITDREMAIEAGLKEYLALHANRLFCSNHIVKKCRTFF